MTYLIPLFWVALATLADAMMDIVRQEFKASVFDRLKPGYTREWFESAYVTKYRHHDPVYGLKRTLAFMWNAWYAAKTLRVVASLLAIATGFTGPLPWIYKAAMVGAGVVVWQIVFEVAYGVLLRQPGLRWAYIRVHWLYRR